MLNVGETRVTVHRRYTIQHTSHDPTHNLTVLASLHCHLAKGAHRPSTHDSAGTSLQRVGPSRFGTSPPTGARKMEMAGALAHSPHIAASAKHSAG